MVSTKNYKLDSVRRLPVWLNFTHTGKRKCKTGPSELERLVAANTASADPKRMSSFRCVSRLSSHSAKKKAGLTFFLILNTLSTFRLLDCICRVFLSSTCGVAHYITFGPLNSAKSKIRLSGSATAQFWACALVPLWWCWRPCDLWLTYQGSGKRKRFGIVNYSRLHQDYFGCFHYWYWSCEKARKRERDEVAFECDCQLWIRMTVG